MVSWDVCMMPKDDGGLGLIDVSTHVSILASKWVVRCLEGEGEEKVEEGGKKRKCERYGE